jgi:chaperone modulatory protein CbpM
MSESTTVFFEVEEVCEAVGISTQTLIEIVELGIVEPEVSGESWHFDPEALPVVKRASRLKNDLDIDWPGIALALDILNELDSLRAENQMLKQRLDRFLQD